MLLPQSTYCSEGLANFDAMMMMNMKKKKKMIMMMMNMKKKKMMMMMMMMNMKKKNKKKMMMMNMKKKKMMLMMMMTTIIMIMIMIMMIMTVASVDQRPGWGEHVKNPWSLWCSLHGWKNHGKKRSSSKPWLLQPVSFDDFTSYKLPFIGDC